MQHWILYMQEETRELYLVHANYAAGGYKRHRFRESGLWSYDHQDYFSKGLFLTFELQPPQEPPDFEEWDAKRRARLHVYGLQQQHDQVQTLCWAKSQFQ